MGGPVDRAFIVSGLGPSRHLPTFAPAGIWPESVVTLVAERLSLLPGVGDALYLLSQ